MKITLGIGIGSTHLQGRNAFDTLACGPAVLLEVLEQRLGLSGRRPSQGQRIAAYRRALERLLQRGDVFYARSFQRDSFAVAETLLGWRDELLLNGLVLDAGEVGAERIDCLRLVETHCDPESRCSEAERIWQIRDRLSGCNHGIEDLQVVDPEEWFPVAWRELLARLGASYCPPELAPAEDSDLGRFQQALLGGDAVFEFRGDDSIEFVTAYSEAVLAPAAAQRIAAAGASAVLVEGENLRLVDAALERTDQPISGVGERSRARPIPQLLNLVLQLQWQPFDPQQLLDFLVHPECPVKASLRRRLARAMIAEPGVGGRAWADAIGRARESATKRHVADPDALAKALKRIDDDLDEWLAEPALNPDGAAGPALAAVAMRLGDWANRRAQLSEKGAPMFRQLHGLATEFAGIIREQATTTRAGVERLLRQLEGSGVAVSDQPAELGHVPVFPVAGLVVPVDTVIWWNFAEPPSPPSAPWTRAEREALARRNVLPPGGEELARQSAARQLRPILAARKKLVLCKATQRNGEEIPEHPLWTRLLTAVKQSRRRPLLRNVDEYLIHADRCGAFKLEEKPAIELPRLRRWLQLPAGTVVPPRERESFSSLKTFVGSPLEWVCQYAAGLSPGSLASSRLSVDARLKGQLIHRLVEIMFPPTGPTFAWQDSSEADLEAWIAQHWPPLLRQEGALLLLAGHQSDASSLRTLARRTLLNLIAMLRRHEARNIIADHQPEAQEFVAGQLKGKIDLCYETGGGEKVVVDLKFGSHSERETEMRDNTALQLAVYGHLISSGDLDPPPKSAFYIIAKRQWITGDGGFFGVRGVDTGEHGRPDMQTCWDRFQEVWRWRRAQVDAGRLENTFCGTDLTEESRPPHAAWGPVENDGRYSDFVKLAGWKEGA